MADSFAKALEALLNGQALPLVPPSGEYKCPVGRVRIGVFFDGTGNNKWVHLQNEGKAIVDGKPEDTPNGPTNVVRLYEAYKTQGTVLDKAYHHGVGTDWDGWFDRTEVDKKADPAAKTPTPYSPSNLEGMMFGVGGKARIDWGLRVLAEFFSNNNNHLAKEKCFDVCGFSRGAALARDFANQVKNQRIANLNEEAEYRFYGLGPLADPKNAIYTQPMDYGASSKEVTGRRGNYKPIDPKTVFAKFMAIYDTVEAWGAGTGKWLPHVDHNYVETCVHMIAEDEFRYLFPVTSIFMDPNTSESRRKFDPVPNRPPPVPTDKNYQEPRDYEKWMLEVWYPGCHSDVGGSYMPRANKKWHLQFITLRDMHKAMLKAGVPIGNVSLPLDGNVVKWYEEYCGYRQGKDFALHQEKAPGQTQYVHWYSTDEYMARFFGIDKNPDLIYRGLNSGLAALAQSGGGGAGYMPPPPPPPPPPPHEKWPAALKGLAMDAREHQRCVQDLVREYIHDSATESPGSSLFGESLPKDGKGRLRLQRKVIPTGAQAWYIDSNNKWHKVRNERRPPKSTT